MSEIITVTGTVEEIIYSNPDNGYSVVGIDSVEEGQFTATGYMPFITEGESVALSGNWTTHPDYGEQFKAEYYETVMPSDEESIIKYLSSGIISCILEATAKKLIDHFGLDVLQIMLTQPSKLAEIKGNSKEKAKSGRHCAILHDFGEKGAGECSDTHKSCMSKAQFSQNTYGKVQRYRQNCISTQRNQ